MLGGVVGSLMWSQTGHAHVVKYLLERVNMI